ncbi:hypothetical protein SAMN05216446_0482 [Parafannyhessea umbonata]|uniref:Uncharacterized protein n=2 Tax=Parafannyhessea umbonata TaxID=604330 RepID=A0A1H9NHZ3_9ACTN|nr:hypothetical protein SAMN05216446_0482 [Parafannyhessea umbonata]
MRRIAARRAWSFASLKVEGWAVIVSENAPSIEVPIQRGPRRRAELVGKRVGLPTVLLERLALFAIVLRVFMMIAWSPIATASPELSALKLCYLSDALVMAVCILILFVRAGRWGVIGCLVLALGVTVMYLSAELSHSDSLMIDLLVVFTVSFVEPRRLCKTYAIVALISIVIVMLLSMTGAIIMREFIPNGRLVFAYGFGHPNTLGGLLLSALGALMYVYWDSRHWAISFVLAVVAAVFAKVTLSSNSAAALLVIVAFACFVGHIDATRSVVARLRRMWVPLLILAPTVLGLIMLLLTANHGGYGILADIVDRLTHLRPSFANQYYVANGGFTLFGRPYVHSSTYHNGLGFAAVDSSYSYMSLVNGMVALLACFVAYVVLVVRSRGKRVHPFAVAAILIYVVYGVVEGYPMYLHSNFTLLLLAGLGRTALSRPTEIRRSPTGVNG